MTVRTLLSTDERMYEIFLAPGLVSERGIAKIEQEKESSAMNLRLNIFVEKISVGCNGAKPVDLIERRIRSDGPLVNYLYLLFLRMQLCYEINSQVIFLTR